MSKYNNKKVEYNGITFDSKMERDYYVYLLELQQKGVIEEIKLQPTYTLFEGYTLDGKKVRPILYRADFETIHQDGKVEVIDVKGFEDSTFKLKKKLFEGKFHIPLKLVTYSKIDGGFIELEELKRARKRRKIEKDRI